MTANRKKRVLAYSLPALAAAVGAGAGHAFRSRLERKHTFRPSRYPEGDWTPRERGLPAEDVWFFSADGEELHGWWIPQPEALGTLLYCHGSAGSIGEQVEVLTELSRLRLNVFAFDYRGYGRSGGRPSKAGVFRDARAAYDHVVGSLAQPARTVLLLGHSLGGAIAIDCAVHRRVAGLIVQSSFIDTKQMARELYERVPMHWIARRQFRSIDKVAGLDLPKLFVHGDADGTVPMAHGERLFEAASDPKELFIVPRAGHNDVHHHGGDGYLERLSKFRDDCLSAR